jgi:formylglycine-generating enzyme required for sulfatase activity
MAAFLALGAVSWTPVAHALPKGESVAGGPDATPEKTAGLYLVLDLFSGDGTETVYSVSYLDKVPKGGWGEEFKTDKIVLRRIDPGRFAMGSPLDEIGRSSNEVQHFVTITRPYYIGVFEVTRKQWQNIMGTTNSYFEGDMAPVSHVSYDAIRGTSRGMLWPASPDVDATSFLGKLRSRTKGFRWDLPTEAQWEYACRADTSTALNSGKDVSGTGRDDNMAKVGRYYYNSKKYPPNDSLATGLPLHAVVGSSPPNGWGLYDMHGNVAEWCLDWYMPDFGTATATDPAGPGSGAWRVLRGGNNDANVMRCRAACRGCFLPSSHNHLTGFRLVACPVR